jgi:hypothetical protein
VCVLEFGTWIAFFVFHVLLLKFRGFYRSVRYICAVYNFGSNIDIFLDISK